MEIFYYHYTDQTAIDGFVRNGIYSGSTFTVDEYYDAVLAGQRLGIPPPVWVLKFKSDIGFRKLTGGIVDSSNRYRGGVQSCFRYPLKCFLPDQRMLGDQLFKVLIYPTNLFCKDMLKSCKN